MNGQVGQRIDPIGVLVRGRGLLKFASGDSDRKTALQGNICIRTAANGSIG